jgi:hypothetical protein
MQPLLKTNFEQESYTPGVILEFPKVEIEKRARKSGVMNEPAPTSAELDSNEREITAYYRNVLGIEKNKLEDRLSDIRRQKESILDDVKSEKSYKAIEKIQGEIEQDLVLVKIESEAEIKKSQDTLDSATRNLRYHQATYSLEGVVPENKKSGELRHNAFLILIALAEFAMLALFYAEASDSGYLGGLGMAAILSGLNMGLAYLISECLLDYKKPYGTKKIQRLIGATLFSSMLLASIIFAAHFRFAINEVVLVSASSAVVNETWDASKLAWTTIVNQGVLVGDVMSWFLIFTSIAIAVAFIRKLQSYQTTNNKHWELYQAVISAEKNLEESKKHYLDRINTVFVSKKNAVVEVAETLNKKVDLLRQHWDKYNSQISVFEHYVGEVEDACNRNLGTYRIVNRQIATSAAPAYFSSKYALPDVKKYIDQFHDGYKESGADEVLPLIKKFDSYAAASVKGIQGKQEQYLTQLHI